jgi:predicted transposase YbfD/YdcC
VHGQLVINYNKLVLGQCKVEEKSNEITAIPELIKVLDIAGCLVTIDAMGCQKEIVKSIVEKSWEYIIALKKNQGNLYKNVEEIFKQAISKGFEGFKHSEFHTKQEEHGREEIRHYLMLSDIKERIAVNLLGKEKSQKLGTKSKQFCAGWDDEYLEKILKCI